MARTRDLQTLIDSVEPAAGEMLTVPAPVARRAVSVVASYARDADDCRLLLQALGLAPEDGQEAQEPAPGRAAVTSTAAGAVTGAWSAPAGGVPPSPLPDDTAPARRRRLRP
ncbi:hypothetical protein ACFRKE_36110 [Kitasatospora indigofera]|uniref:hypothetical protein n=1 Tax=Kitasatospora indigofera TaxID=67307 RepID=UPI00369C365C